MDSVKELDLLGTGLVDDELVMNELEPVDRQTKRWFLSGRGQRAPSHEDFNEVGLPVHAFPVGIREGDTPLEVWRHTLKTNLEHVWRGSRLHVSGG